MELQKSENSIKIEPSSFRDPSGFVFFRNGVICRQVNLSYKDYYDQLMRSGLYESLTHSRLLLPHDEVALDPVSPDNCYKIIKPQPIPFISYPYEWSFSQLKDAALITLEIQKESLKYGMSLKDCSAYNVQFLNGQPIFIDSLSFEMYREGQPWVAYRQFCQHFLAPLALMSYVDIRLNELFKTFIDGVPLNLASSLLPFRTRLRFSLLSHIHLHAKSQSKFADKAIRGNQSRVSRLGLLGLIDNLHKATMKMNWQPRGTEWVDYYEDTNYSSKALSHKKQLVADFLERTSANVVWDLGANTGIFSRIASEREMQAISFDIDPAAAEINYLQCVKKRETKILPLLLDLTNPSPNIGWENHERMTILDRGPADTALALALVHHLAISNNVPFCKIASLFSKICKYLIIEFIPKNDSQVQRLLSSREDIFTKYVQPFFEEEFRKVFTIMDSVKIQDSERTIYLMENNKR